MLDELFNDATTAVNCKNVLFTDISALEKRFAAKSVSGP
jgi:hypothetical protein